MMLFTEGFWRCRISTVREKWAQFQFGDGNDTFVRSEPEHSRDLTSDPEQTYESRFGICMQISADTTSSVGCVAMVLDNRSMKIEAGGDC